MSDAVAEIDGDAAALQPVQRQQMRIGEIGYVHVVTQAGSVQRGVVVAIHVKLPAPAERRVDHQRNEVRLRPMVLAIAPPDQRRLR